MKNPVLFVSPSDYENQLVSTDNVCAFMVYGDKDDDDSIGVSSTAKHTHMYSLLDDQFADLVPQLEQAIIRGYNNNKRSGVDKRLLIIRGE